MGSCNIVHLNGRIRPLETAYMWKYSIVIVIFLPETSCKWHKMFQVHFKLVVAPIHPMKPYATTTSSPTKLPSKHYQAIFALQIFEIFEKITCPGHKSPAFSKLHRNWSQGVLIGGEIKSSMWRNVAGVPYVMKIHWFLLIRPYPPVN